MGITTTTTKRRAIRAGMALTGVALFAAIVPAASASADDPYSADNLLRVCNGAPGDQTQGLSGSCTFEVQGDGGQHVEWRRYGDPVSNCNAGTTTAIQSMVGDTRSFSESWSAGGTGGIGLGPISISGGGNYSQTRSVTSERRDTVTANPGRKTAVTMGTGFVDQTGRIRVDVEVYDNSGGDGGVYVGTEAHYIDGIARTVPTGYQEKGQDEVSCAEDFRVPA